MRSVLGINAAWTDREPSGVALIADDGFGWRLMEVAAYYAAFLQPPLAAGPVLRHRGSIPDAAAIIDGASVRVGSPVDIVAVDIPLATTPIIGRRAPAPRSCRKSRSSKSCWSK